MTELPIPDRQTPDALMLSGFWYRALSSAELTRNRLHRAMLLEIPSGFGPRSAGQGPFALRDACPHRGMPLSCGRFDGKTT